VVGLEPPRESGHNQLNVTGMDESYAGSAEKPVISTEAVGGEILNR
jgi:hypothetical protein